ncbi:DUF547 domain-containing protein [Saccharospirillum impatiens]|uniref:DUF547 domain-containing protein n=1 Tax=Saccharospirillum impatiens TaxID=169438 RepID=UPI000412A5EC|nr:DUF547 domain-containing protein [Saccharospirillum impatiens]
MLIRQYPIFTVLLILLLLNPMLASAFDHSQFDRLLVEHVAWTDEGHASVVDYASLQEDHRALVDYLDVLADVSRQEFDDWPEKEQLAFLINAYNAWTLELILTEYPDLESIRDLGSLFRSPWKREFVSLLGEERSLDNVEHDLIRGSDRYNDPRIHFAVNCASIGCPALRTEVYTANKLDRQLEGQTRRFLSDQSRNRLSGSELQVSSIFKWYREDFEAGWRGESSLTGFLSLYADSLSLNSAQIARLKADDIKVSFLDYDWVLNDSDR